MPGFDLVANISGFQPLPIVHLCRFFRIVVVALQGIGRTYHNFTHLTKTQGVTALIRDTHLTGDNRLTTGTMVFLIKMVRFRKLCRKIWHLCLAKQLQQNRTEPVQHLS